MTEGEKWERGVAAVREEYALLSPLLKARLKKCAAAIKSCKQALQLIGERVRADEICGKCRGECCARGKNHVTAIDLLIYLNDDREIFTPCFAQEICPYLGENGCLMDPEYRPYNCITFICEQVEGLLGPLEKERSYAVERQLRGLYGNLEQLFDNSFRYDVLGIFERQQRKQAPQ
jgi:hypothetical protein